MDRFEFVALIPNALGYPELETLSALSFGSGLEVVATAVSVELQKCCQNLYYGNDELYEKQKRTFL